MTFYLIGLGLNENSITLESLEIINSCTKIYLESYTVDFPYKISQLEKTIRKKITILKRETVEKEEFLLESKEKNIALLVYGAPLSATTHISLLERCKKEKILYKIIYNGSIFDAIAQTGLQLYKFGKVASMPCWIKGKYEPMSFTEIIKDNQKILAHTLILVDIGLEYEDAVWQLIESIKRTKVKTKKIIVCSALGTDENKIVYGEFSKILEQEIKKPYCFVIPSEELHFQEKEIIEGFSV